MATSLTTQTGIHPAAPMRQRAARRNERALPVRNDPLPRQSLTVLGVDPGLERTGYAILSMPLGKVVDAGLIRSNGRRPLSERLLELVGGIEDVMDEHGPTLVGVEELFAHYAHPRTAILMGHARGIVLLTAARRGVEVVGLLPTRIKKMMTGNGHASKLQMQRAVTATLGLSRMPQPSDVADAIAIAWCAGTLGLRHSGAGVMQAGARR